MLPDNQQIAEETKEEIKHVETNENENSDPKPMGHSKNISKREMRLVPRLSGMMSPKEG